MRMPDFISDTLALARRDPLWAVAFVACALLPLMLIYARVGAEICSAIMGLAFLWRSARLRQWHWLHEPFALACLVAWAWLLLVVTPLAANPGAGWVGAAMWFRLPLMLLAARYFVLQPAPARTALAVILALMLALVAFDTLWQLAQGVSLTGNPRIEYSQRLTGPFDSPKVGIFMGRVLLPIIGLCLMAALVRRSKRAAAASLGLLLMVIATIIFTGERAAFLTTALGCTVAAGLLIVTEKRLRLPILAMGLLFVVALVVLFETDSWVHTRGTEMFNVMRHYPQSEYGQLVQAALAIGQEHWLHGVGLRGFRDFCPELHAGVSVFRGLHPHNAFAEWFAEAGLVGLLLFAGIVATLLREALRHLRGTQGVARLLPAVAVGVLVQHFFPLMGMQSFFSNWSALLLWYSLSLMFAALPPRTALSFRRAGV